MTVSFVTLRLSCSQHRQMEPSDVLSVVENEFNACPWFPPSYPLFVSRTHYTKPSLFRPKLVYYLQALAVKLLGAESDIFRPQTTSFSTEEGSRIASKTINNTL